MGAEETSTRLAWTTETQPPIVDPGPRTCRHGKDAGQTCYPCDIIEDTEPLQYGETGA